MAPSQAARPESFRNEAVTATIVQQGKDNAGRDIYNAPVTVLYDRHPKPPPSSTVPFRRDDHFIRRDGLDKIHQICAKPASRAALVGLGGVGKSQIAIEYAYRVRDESPTTWVFWVHAGTQARFEEGYRRIAETTRVEGWDNPKADVLRLVRNWLCDESNGRWVIVIDNADDSSVFFPLHNRSQAHGANNLSQAAEPLSDFLPQSLKGSILITSRNAELAYDLVGSHANIVEVKPLDGGDALALLQKKLSFDAGEKAVELLQALDYMPLAITQAAAYIEQRSPRMTISRYLDEVRRSDHDRARLLNKGLRDSRRDGRASNSIISTWQISFEHIRKDMPTAARLLSLMSLFDRQGIPESLLYNRYRQDEDGEADFEDDIHTLTSYSLVKMSADGKEFEMHRLVQFSTKKWLELYDELEGWREKYVRLMDDSYPVGRHENWIICRALFPHAQAAVGCRPTDAKAVMAWASVLFKAAWYASEMGKYDIAKEMDIGALQAREATLGLEHPDTLSSFNSLGLVLKNQGNYEEAEAMHRRDLEGSEKTLGPEHPDTLTSVSNLGSVLERQGKYKEAEAMHRRDLEGSEKTLGPEHPDTLVSVSHLGSVLVRQGKYKKAEAMHWRSLKGYEKVLGPEHPDTLTSVSHLGSVLESQGKYKEAEVMHWRSLKGYEKVLGPEHPHTLTSVSHLGSVLESQGKYKEAEAMHRRSLKGWEKVLGPEHPDMLASVSYLGSVFRKQGKYKEAEAMHRRSLKGYEKVLGPEHPHTLTSVSNLGSVLESQGKYKEAEAMHRRDLEGSEKTLGPEHPDTLASVSNLGSVLESQGKYKEAEAMYRRDLEGSEKTLGPEHPDTLASVSNLGSVFRKQGKYKEAEAMHRRSLKGYEKVLGLEHPYTLTSVSNLGSVLESQGKYKEAEAMRRRSLKGREKVLGPEHPDTLASASRLGSVFRKQGKYKEAEAMRRRSLKGREKVLGLEHPDTLTSVSHVGSVLESQTKYKEAEATHAHQHGLPSIDV